MREISVPASYQLGPQENLTDVIVDNATRRPNLTVLSRPGPDGWAEITSTGFLAEVTAVAKGLVASGVQPGDRIGLLSKTRYEWTLFDFAIWFAGAVTVPIYETSSAEQVRWILSDSAAVTLIVETTKHQAMVSGLQPDLPSLRQILTIDGGAVADLTATGATVDDAQIEERRRSLTADSVATIIYTSGTTGRPKGCELTHANFLGLARSAATLFPDLVNEDASTLLFLPLAHVFARYIQILSLVAGSTLGHSPTVTNLLADLAAFQPTYLLAVPRVFEKIYNGAEAKAQAGGKGAIFARAAETAVAYSKALDNGGPGLPLKLKHAVFDRLVYSKLRTATGGRLNGSVSGGAPLGPRLGHFFRGIGLPVLEGWGLTETAAPATVNTLAQNKIGTVGRPLPGTTIRLGPDDELQVKGVGVLRGYYNNPPGAESLVDGWFHTGDLGSIDDDGFVSITGRKKEILITAGGKNVVPAVLEDHLRAHPLISQCIVVGDQKPFIGCLITLDAEMLPTWLSNHGKATLTVEQAASDPEVKTELQRAVDAANAQVSKAESIRKFEVLTTDFTEASGHLTPKLSLKRAVVMKDFATQVESLYS
ncbi:MAG TPA: AMP-dependent synthetase/ligase [Kineosporiaceae bacterium]|nr:AMP-dependent synthetase/ligase [Kineosporiaceae bacterium]